MVHARSVLVPPRTKIVLFSDFSFDNHFRTAMMVRVGSNVDHGEPSHASYHSRQRDPQANRTGAEAPQACHAGPHRPRPHHGAPSANRDGRDWPFSVQAESAAARPD